MRTPTLAIPSLAVITLLTLTGTPARGAPVAYRGLGLAGDLGFGAMGSDAYTTLQAGMDIHEGRLALGLFGKVRILMQQAEGDEEAIRRRDWDEVSDYVHIMRNVDYARDFGEVTLDARAGELYGFTLGHGSIIRDYSNIADMDHPHTGLRMNVRHDRFEVEAVLDNLVRPAVVAGRVAARPFAGLRDLCFGLSGAMDPTAPFQVRTQLDGQRVVDVAWNLQSETRVMGLTGLDISYLFGSEQEGTLQPYLDVNTSFFGAGAHVGFFGRLPLPRGELGFQAEYNGSSTGYAANYMGTFYDIERQQAGLALEDPTRSRRDDRDPKLAGLGRSIYGGHGALVQAGLKLQDLGATRLQAQLRAGYAYIPGPDANQVWVRLNTQPFSRLDLGLMLYMRGLGGPYPDENGVVALAEGRYRITRNLYGLAQYSRTWSLREDTRYFGVLQVFNLSVGANWSM